MIGRPRPGRRIACTASTAWRAGPCSPSTASPAPSFDRALQELEGTEGIRVRSVVGLNDDGVFGATRKDWRPDLPDACHEPFVPLLWLKILELLGSVPEGSTARSLEDGSLPD